MVALCRVWGWHHNCSSIPRCSPIEVTRCSLVVSHVAFGVGTARSESLQVVFSVKLCGGLALPWLLIKLHVVLKEDRGHQSGTEISEIKFMFVCLIKHLHCVLLTSFPFLHSLGCQCPCVFPRCFIDLNFFFSREIELGGYLGCD